MLRNFYGLGDYNTDQIRELAQAVEEGDLDPTSVFYRRPDAASLDFVAQIPLEEVSRILPDAFAGGKGTELVSRLSIPQLERIGAEADLYLKETIKLNLLKAVAMRNRDDETTLKKVAAYVNQSPAWQL